MKVFILTSSRADYGIYRPLLRALQDSPKYDLNLIVFGTHMSKHHGYTVTQIENDGYHISKKISNIIAGDNSSDISTSMALTSMKFADYWEEVKEEADLVFALGDRYEMFAAVSASVPFNIPIAHLHGGETTLGAIDDKLRHCISLCSKYHFCSTQEYAHKIEQLTGSANNIWNVGALSLDNLHSLDLLSDEEFKEKFHIDLTIPSILVTVHPETIALNDNVGYADLTVKVLQEKSKSHQIIITLPNADTMGQVYREKFLALKNLYNIQVVENFGLQGYFTCMNRAKYLFGNTSSGIIEAASFGKYVINVGNRQKGRASGKNVFHVPFQFDAIMSSCEVVEASPELTKENVYYSGGAVDKIIKVLDSIRRND